MLFAKNQHKKADNLYCNLPKTKIWNTWELRTWNWDSSSEEISENADILTVFILNLIYFHSQKKQKIYEIMLFVFVIWVSVWEIHFTLRMNLKILSIKIAINTTHKYKLDTIYTYSSSLMANQKYTTSENLILLFHYIIVEVFESCLKNIKNYNK